MAWIKLNSETNAKVTTLPTSFYTEGSLCVLETLYGDIEYIYMDSIWNPFRALTDITIYISNDIGVNAPYNRGTAGAPFKTLEYALDLLPPKIINLNINILDMPASSNHGAFGYFSNFSKTDEGNYISINGSIWSPQETPFVCNGSSLILNDSYVKVDLTNPVEYSSIDMVFSGPISAYGIDSESGLQYVEIANTTWDAVGVEFGMGVANDMNSSLSFVVKSENVGSNLRIHLLTSSFTAVGQTLELYQSTDELSFIECIFSLDSDKIGKIWPVFNINTNSILVPKSTTFDPASGEQFRGVSLPHGTFEFKNITHDIRISKIANISHSLASYNGTALNNCSGMVTFSESSVNGLYANKTPNIVSHRTILSGVLNINNSFSFIPNYLNEHYISEVVDMMNTVPTPKPEAGFLLFSSVLYLNQLEMLKSSMSMKYTSIKNRKVAATEYLISLDGSYIQGDKTTYILGVRDAAAILNCIVLQNNSNIDTPANSFINFPDTTTPVKITSGSGIFKESNYKVYQDRTALINDVFVPNGILGSILTEPGNIYLRQNDKWVVMTGNKYTTASIPDGTIFTLPDGLEIFDLTTNKEVTWRT